MADQRAKRLAELRSRRRIMFDLSNETPESALRVIDIAREVVRTEGNALPGKQEGGTTDGR